MAIVGSADVVIRAITTKLESDIQGALDRAGKKTNGDDIGGRLGDDIGDGIRGGVDEGINDGIRDGGKRSRPEAENSGNGIGNSISKGIKNGLGDLGDSVIAKLGLRLGILVPIFGALGGGIASIATGLFTMGSAAAQASTSLIAIPGLLAAAAQAGGTVLVAFSGVGQAIKDGLKQAPPVIDAATGKIDKFKTSMNALSPAAGSFVQYILSIQKNLSGLKRAAGQELFPKLESAMKRLVNGLFPQLKVTLRETGNAVGNAAISISKNLSSGPFVRNFATVTSNNTTVISKFGKILGNLARVFVALLVAAGPVIDQLTNWILDLSRRARVFTETSSNVGKLTTKFNTAGASAAQIGRIIGNLIEGIHDFGKAASGPGQNLVNVLERATKRFADFTDKAGNTKKLEKFFKDSADNFHSIAKLADDLSLAFIRLGADPSIGKIAEALRKLVPELEHLLKSANKSLGTDLVDFLDALLDAFQSFQDSGSLKIVIETLTAFAKVVGFAFSNPVTGPPLKFLTQFAAAMFAISLIRKFPGIGLLESGIGKLGKRAVEGQDLAGLSTNIKKELARAAGAVKTQAGVIATSLKTRLVAGFKQAGSTARTVGSTLKSGLEVAKNSATTFATTLKTKLVAGLRTAQSTARTVGSTIKSGLEVAKNGAISAAKTVKTQLVASFKQAQSTARTLGSTIKSGLEVAKNSAASMATTLKTKLIAGLKTAQSTGRTFASTLKSGFDSAVSSTKALATQAKTAATAGIGKLSAALKSGAAAARGFAAAQLASAKATVKDIALKIRDRAVTIAKAVAEKAAAIGTKIFAAAQAALNFVLSANPIGIIILAIVALVAAFVLAYKKSETFRNIVNGAFHAISAVVGAVVGFIKAHWQTLLVILTGPIGLAIGLVIKNFDKIKLAVQTVITAVKVIFNGLVNFLRAFPAKVGAYFVNTFLRLVTAARSARDKVVVVITAVVGFVKSLPRRISAAAGDLFASIKKRADALRVFILLKVAAIVGFFRSLPGRIRGAAGDLFAVLRQKIAAARNYVSQRIGDILGAVRGLGSKIAGLNPFGGLIDKARSALRAIVNAFNSLDVGLHVHIPSFIPKIGGKGIDINDIIPDIRNPFAEGGTVRATRGGIVGLVGEAGRDERITPLRRDGLSNGEAQIINALGQEKGNFTVNVYPAPGMNEREIGMAAFREYSWRRKTAVTG